MKLEVDCFNIHKEETTKLLSKLIDHFCIRRVLIKKPEVTDNRYSEIKFPTNSEGKSPTTPKQSTPPFLSNALYYN